MTNERNGLAENRISSITWRSLLLCVAVFFVMSTFGFGGDTGSISGAVTDPSGAVVPGVIVVIRNQDTALQESCVADTEGLYKFVAVPQGRYQIEIVAHGFKPYMRKEVELAGRAIVKVDIALELQLETTTVEVNAETAQIDLSSNQLGETIEATKIASVPLNGRSFTDLIAINLASFPPVRSNLMR